MKTKNNIQKTIFTSLAIGASAILISVTVNAQYYWNAMAENHSFTKSEIVLVEKSTITNPAAANSKSSYASLLEKENEEPLGMENWMMNENNFNVSSFQLIEEKDTKLELQDWMLNKNLFERASEPEQPLQMEDWMLSEKIWMI